MKTIFLVLALLCVISNVWAQGARKTTYLALSIRADWDRKNQKGCYRIFVDSGNPYAADVYKLVWFYVDKTQNQAASFLSSKSDTATVFYNYFPNITAALTYMADHGWELMTVNNAMHSDYSTHNAFSEINPIPVYIFKKKVE